MRSVPDQRGRASIRLHEFEHTLVCIVGAAGAIECGTHQVALPARPRLAEDIQAVIGQVAGLIRRELADIGVLINMPRAQHLGIECRRGHQLAIVRKADLACVEQMVDVGGQHQAIRIIEVLAVIAYRPGLDVTGHEVARLLDAGHPARRLPGKHAIAEPPLADPGGPAALWSRCRTLDPP